MAAAFKSIWNNSGQNKSSLGEILERDDMTERRIVEWHGLHRQYKQLDVIDVDLLWQRGQKKAPSPLANPDIRHLYTHWLDLYEWFYDYYYFIQKREFPYPYAHYKDFLLRRTASFCDDLRNLMIRPAERFRHPYWQRLHLPFVEIDTTSLFRQYSALNESLKLWHERGYDFPEDEIRGKPDPFSPGAFSHIADFDFDRFFKENFATLTLRENPNDRNKFRQEDIQKLEDFIQYCIDDVLEYLKENAHIWGYREIKPVIRIVQSRKIGKGEGTSLLWLSSEEGRMILTVNLAMQNSSFQDVDLVIMLRRIKYMIRHEMFHCHHLGNLQQRFTSEYSDIPSFLNPELSKPIPFKSAGRMTMRSSEFVPGEFGADGFAMHIARVRFFGKNGMAGDKSREHLEDLICAQYIWLQIMINNQAMHVGHIESKEAGLASLQENGFYYQKGNHPINLAIYKSAMNKQSITSFDPYVTEVYGQLLPLHLETIHRTEVMRQTFDFDPDYYEKILAMVSYSLIDGTQLLNFLQTYQCIGLNDMPCTRHKPPEHWYEFNHLMQHRPSVRFQTAARPGIFS